MVALASARARGVAGAARAWVLAAVGVILLGSLPRLGFAAGPGERSAVVLALLFEVSLALAAWLVWSPRAAFIVSLAATVAFDLAALPPRAEPGFDDWQALYRTDQSLVLQAGGSGQLLPLLVEPRFDASQPRWRLAGEIDGHGLTWDCQWRHGRQRILLSLPSPAAGGSFAVRLRLDGAPSHDGDYLIVYSSSAMPTIPLLAEANAAEPSSTVCGLGAG